MCEERVARVSLALYLNSYQHPLHTHTHNKQSTRRVSGRIYQCNRMVDAFFTQEETHDGMLHAQQETRDATLQH
jgi:hypothetical protein